MMVDTQEPETKRESGFAGQTFLVGEHVYIRGFVPGDEKNATSWRSSVFPQSPELVEKWIKEELPKEGDKQRQHLAIVRKSDDVVVGRIIAHYNNVGMHLDPYVDVLYGEPGQHWLAEAVDMVARWQVDERFVPTCGVVMGSHQEVAVHALLGAGFVQTASWREMIEVNGQRYNKLSLGYFSEAWIDRVGHPMDAEVPTAGDGEVHPVPASVKLEGDPPKQAVMVGKRLYLRPQDKDDASRYVQGERLETESFYSIGRQLKHVQSWESLIGGQANDDFPTNLWFEVCFRENDESIGAVGLLDVDYVNRTAETGSHFYSADFRGKGYGLEAKHLLLEYTFDVLGLHMVRSFVDFPNTRSAAALRKQGYRESGRVCWLYPYEGKFGNMLTFDLLADEWRALPRET